MKLEKDKREHPLTAWDKGATVGKDYDECVRYIINKFIALNKDPMNRQVRQSDVCIRARVWTSAYVACFYTPPPSPKFEARCAQTPVAL